MTQNNNILAQCLYKRVEDSDEHTKNEIESKSEKWMLLNPIFGMGQYFILRQVNSRDEDTGNFKIVETAKANIKYKSLIDCFKISLHIEFVNAEDKTKPENYIYYTQRKG